MDDRQGMNEELLFKVDVSSEVGDVYYLFTLIEGCIV